MGPAKGINTPYEIPGAMPKFIDAHPLKPLTEQQLRAAYRSPKDEFGVAHHDLLYDEKENKLFCVLDAPSKQAIERHHAKLGIKCDWIHEVKSTR